MYAQDALRVGQMVKQTMKESWHDIEPIGTDEERVYYVTTPYTETLSGMVVGDAHFHLLAVDHNAEVVKKNPINFNIDGRESHYEFTKEINGKIYFFSSIENKKEKLVTFYSHELNKKDLVITNPRKVVELSFSQVKREYDHASFAPELSQDKSKLLISYALVEKDGGMLTFGYVVLDEALKEVNKWAGNLDMSDGVYLFDQFRISNKSEVYLQCRFFKNEKAHDKNAALKKTNFLSTTRSMEYKKNYEHRLVKFEGRNTKIIAIPNQDRFYHVFNTQIAPDGGVVMIGFYSTLEEDAMPHGATCLMVNSKTGAIKTSSKEFGNLFQMPSDITIKNNGLVAGNDQYLKYRFIVSDVFYNKNGGYTLTGERNVTQLKRVQNSYYTVNHLDDLAIVDVSLSGTVRDVYKVEKSQQIEDMQRFNASYYYFEHNDSRYVTFANLGKASFHESVIVNIDSNGKQSRQIMFSTKDAEVTIKPQDCAIHKGRLIMYGSKNNRYSRFLSRAL